MQIVTQSNIDSAPFKNLKEVLDTNSLSIVVRSAYSKDSTIPTCVMQLNTRGAGPKIGRNSSSSSTYIVTATIHNIGSTVAEATGAITIRSAMRALLIAAEDSFSQYNMDIDIQGIEDNLTQLERGDGRVHDAILIVRFIVK